MSREEELMKTLERFGKLYINEADDVDIYNLSNSNGTIVWHMDADNKSMLENLERMELQLKNVLLGYCERIDEQLL